MMTSLLIPCDSGDLSTFTNSLGTRMFLISNKLLTLFLLTFNTNFIIFVKWSLTSYFKWGRHDLSALSKSLVDVGGGQERFRDTFFSLSTFLGFIGALANRVGEEVQRNVAQATFVGGSNDSLPLQGMQP